MVAETGNRLWGINELDYGLFLGELEMSLIAVLALCIGRQRAVLRRLYVLKAHQSRRIDFIVMTAQSVE